MSPTIKRTIRILYDNYMTKSDYACELAEMVNVPCTMSWRKVVYRWLDWKRKDGKWAAGPTQANPRSPDVQAAMVRWVQQKQ